MKKWYSAFFLTLFVQHVIAQTAEEELETSSTGVIIIGVILLIVIAVILYNRQKRKFND